MSQLAQQLSQPVLDAAALDLAAASEITYVLHQRFRYDYDDRVFELDHRLVAVPRSRHGGQRRRLHSVEVSAADASLDSRRDAHGNVVTRVRLREVTGFLELSVSAVVDRSAAVAGAVLPLSSLRDPRLLLATPLTRPDAWLTEIATDLRHGVADDLEFADRVCEFLHGAITYEHGCTSVTTTAAEAFAGGRGVCQDHAHVMLAICHAVGVPARYVSGHLVGEGGSHAWVEVVVAEGHHARAVAFDPCNGCRVGATYITVAAGRDYAQVAPTSGRYSGSARGRLTVTKQLGIVSAA